MEDEGGSNLGLIMPVVAGVLILIFLLLVSLSVLVLFIAF